jgi:hypothetical protein
MLIDILLSIPSSMSAIVKVKDNLFIRCRFNQNTTNKKITLHLHPPLLLYSPVLPPPHSAAPLRCLSAPHPHASSRAVPELTLTGQTAPAAPPYTRARVASLLRSADCLAPHPNLPRPRDPALTGAAGPRATAAGRRRAPPSAPHSSPIAMRRLQLDGGGRAPPPPGRSSARLTLLPTVCIAPDCAAHKLAGSRGTPLRPAASTACVYCPAVQGVVRWWRLKRETGRDRDTHGGDCLHVGRRVAALATPGDLRFSLLSSLSYVELL